MRGRARLPRLLQRRRDLPQGCLVDPWSRGLEDRTRPARTLRDADLHARPDLRRPARRNPGRTQRWPSGGRLRHRKHRNARAVRGRVARHSTNSSASRGSPRDAHRPRRGIDRLCRGLLSVLGGQHDGPAGAGASAAQDRRDGWAQVDGTCRGDRRWTAYRLRLLPGVAGVRGRLLCEGSRARWAQRRGARSRRFAARCDRAETARPPSTRAECLLPSTSRRCRRRCWNAIGSRPTRSPR